MIIVFLLITALYFVLNTFFVYSVCGYFACTELMHDIFFLLRDALWIFVVLYFAVKYFRLLKIFLVDNRNVFLVFFIILLGNLLISYFNGISLKSMVVGFKYAYFHLYIFLGASFLGFVFTKASIDKIFTRLFYFFSGLLVVGLVFDLCKLFFPDLLIAGLGFGPVGDYVLGHNPPVYYRTGPGGVMRFSGLWAGPNNYGFLLIGLSPLYFSTYGTSTYKRLLIFVVGLLTLSRALIVGRITGAVIHLYGIRKKLSRVSLMVVLSILSLGTLGVGYLTLYKSSSTSLHILRRSESFLSALQYPFGIGLGQSGPSVHWGGKLLPENFYLQLSIEGGIAMLLLYCIFWWLVYKNSQRVDKTTHLYWLWLGFFAMSVAGMFLHVFEDSMTNYWFFVIFGLAWGNNLQKNNN